MKEHDKAEAPAPDIDRLKEKGRQDSENRLQQYGSNRLDDKIHQMRGAEHQRPEQKIAAAIAAFSSKSSLHQYRKYSSSQRAVEVAPRIAVRYT